MPIFSITTLPRLFLRRLPGNNRGQYVQPSIVARVQYPSGIDVVDGTPIRLGDEIRMEITITDEMGERDRRIY